MRDLATDHSCLALNTGTLGHNVDGAGAGWSAEQIIDACAERGFGAICYWRRELGDRAAEIGERTRAAGLEVCGLCRCPFLVGPLASPDRSMIVDDFHAAIDTAAALGTNCLNMVVGGVGELGTMAAALGRVRELVEAVLPQANAAGVRLAFEPLHPVYAADRSCLVTMRDALQLCEVIDDPGVAVAVDVYHVWWDRSLGEVLQRAGADRIAGLHLCDWLVETKDVLLDRGMMGDGVANPKAVRAAVEDAGYTGYCEVEVFSANDWWQRDPAEVLDVCVERFRTMC